jgi:hypothetical protein
MPALIWGRISRHNRQVCDRLHAGLPANAVRSDAIGPSATPLGARCLVAFEGKAEKLRRVKIDVHDPTRTFTTVRDASGDPTAAGRSAIVAGPQRDLIADRCGMGTNF